MQQIAAHHVACFTVCLSLRLSVSLSTVHISVYVSVCLAHQWAWQKRLNRWRRRLGAGSRAVKEPCIRSAAHWCRLANTIKWSMQGCPFSVLVQQPSGDGDEGDPRWIWRWTTNWIANDRKPSLHWWHHPVGHFEGRTTGDGGSPRPSQLQIQPTSQHWQDQGNGERQHSVPHKR